MKFNINNKAYYLKKLHINTEKAVVVMKNGRNCMENVLVMKSTTSSCVILNFLENTKGNRLHTHHFIHTESNKNMKKLKKCLSVS